MSEKEKSAQEEPQDAPEQPEPQAAGQPPQQEQPEPQAPEKTQEQLLQEQVDSLNDQLLRTMAEYDNFRKRSQREKESIYPQATASAVSQFLPVLDAFERAMEAPCTDGEFKKGVEMILHNFRECLGKLGVEAYGQPGDPFDPQLHNAVAHVEDDSVGAGEIVEVFQRGYRLGERVIRHAMVKVAN